jgi:hypothetical protein
VCHSCGPSSGTLNISLSLSSPRFFSCCLQRDRPFCFSERNRPRGIATMWLSFVVPSLLATTAFASSNSRFFRRQNTTAPYQLQKPPLDTDWTTKVGTNPWPEYPRPQLERANWKNLNGIWQWQNASSHDAVNAPPIGQDLAKSVLVPFCLESAISGMRSNCSKNSSLSLTICQVSWRHI